MGEVANSISLQAVVGAIARTPDADFNLVQTLQTIAEITQTLAGAAGVAVERTGKDETIEVLVTAGDLTGTPKRLPIKSNGADIGVLAIYGTRMFGPATADRVQVVADLAALALTRAANMVPSSPVTMDEAQFRLISGVGHNLRNTLGAATGYMQLVEMETQLSFSQQEYINRSRRAVNAAVSLIADLMELSRADAGKLSFDREPVNVNAVAREAARKHLAAAQAKGCSINVASSELNPTVLTDASYMQQIIDVLIYNAVRYSPRDGRIQINVDMRQGRRSNDPAQFACIAVTDNGGGVPEADKVFEEVHRVEQLKGNVRFKLAICRRIARLLGGDVMLDTAKDAGSTFTLWLPAPAPH